MKEITTKDLEKSILNFMNRFDVDAFDIKPTMVNEKEITCLRWNDKTVLLSDEEGTFTEPFGNLDVAIATDLYDKVMSEVS